MTFKTADGRIILAVNNDDVTVFVVPTRDPETRAVAATLTPDEARRLAAAIFTLTPGDPPTTLNEWRALTGART